MTPRRQRMLAVGLAVTGLAIATALSLTAFRENMMFYIELDQVAAGNVPETRTYRVGGMVKEGTIERASGSMDVEFTITDYQNSLGVRYNGVLPDLFREGQGVIARGEFDENGLFAASEVLAKHDENYMPPEVADALEKTGHIPAGTDYTRE